MKFKKLLVTLFSFAMVVTLASCNKNNEDEFIDYAAQTHYSKYNNDFD